MAWYRQTGNKPLIEPIFTQICVAIWHWQATTGWYRCNNGTWFIIPASLWNKYSCSWCLNIMRKWHRATFANDLHKIHDSHFKYVVEYPNSIRFACFEEKVWDITGWKPLYDSEISSVCWKSLCCSRDVILLMKMVGLINIIIFLRNHMDGKDYQTHQTSFTIEPWRAGAKGHAAIGSECIQDGRLCPFHRVGREDAFTTLHQDSPRGEVLHKSTGTKENEVHSSDAQC